MYSSFFFNIHVIQRVKKGLDGIEFTINEKDLVLGDIHSEIVQIYCQQTINVDVIKVKLITITVALKF